MGHTKLVFLGLRGVSYCKKSTLGFGDSLRLIYLRHLEHAISFKGLKFSIYLNGFEIGLKPTKYRLDQKLW